MSTAALAMPGGPAWAQSTQVFSETIVVNGHGEPVDSASFETRHALDGEAVAGINAASADEILRRLPAVYLPTNSRGETIAFVRNAAERQVAIFYEGADINVPWDNRLDLAMIPAGLIGTARSAAGPLAPHYGVNALGALSLSPTAGLRGKVAYGTGDRFDADLAVPLGPVMVGGSYASRDGEPLSDEADLPYSQVGRKLRTNTDRELASVFGRVGGEVGAHTLSLTAFHVWGNKGIAPESNRASGARFWRYPDLQHTLVVGNARSALGESTELDSVAWYQRFGQTIDSYASAAYDKVASREVDKDRTWGVRELLKHRAGPAMLVGSFNFLQSTHHQRDISYDSAGNPPASLPDALFYKQRNWSVGGELEYDFSTALRAEVGLGYDVVDYMRTGDKPPVKDARDWTGRAGLVLDAGSGWRVRGALGRKMRAPTMRERFGEGIKRFMPNPDLKPERIVTAEVGAEWRGERGGFYVIPFVQDLKNTIDQRNVGSLRQRINLKGSKVKGIEVGGNWRPHEYVTLAGNLTWTHVRRKNADSGTLNRIAEKPSLLANLTASYAHPSGFATSFEALHNGRAYSADTTGDMVPLERSTSFNWQVSQGFRVKNQPFDVFLHVENIGDSLIEPQLGLPAAGRAVRIGIRVG
ncbi:TonB-dependent receptor [Novosphingobium album (ex Liu et al. 2023)]|uniref:TonB-dependent receptor n=1 Tax=Novosphingobium album (ex Liu et al. 2023) TaxID=3031130 RepID=A0ABT5WMB6_9SPHN|nr:TonB-dependent receptor [Novosphingobium album (ex Liu et al. 2023)]MDE8651190.1 TonB-dependent receptor [Novosphingobium album (ex Liu et al. 2023)]